jgi:HEPN domain-containing protein
MNGPPASNPSQWEEAGLWLSKAAEDIAAAHLLLSAEMASSASFHAQQAMEKILKALLVAARQDVRRTHDLGDLSSEANRFWPTLIPTLFPLAAIGRWYLTSRYPGTDDPPPSLTEIAEALTEIEELMAAVRGQITP